MLHSTIAKVIITGVLALTGGGFLVYSSLGDASYYEMVDKVAVQPDEYVGKDLKLHGYVMPGSIRVEVVGSEAVRHFVLERNGERIPVRYVGPKPDNLEDRSEVVAMGRLRDDGGLQFAATELMAKCPSKYQGAPSNRDLF
jgi:cytochrome c-type biogenesis protein CcmE